MQSPHQQQLAGEERLQRVSGSSEGLPPSGGSGGFGVADPMQRRPLSYWSAEEKASFMDVFKA